ENSRCSGLGGSSSSTKPQRRSKTFLPTRPASTPAMTLTGVNRSFTVGLLRFDFSGQAQALASFLSLSFGPVVHRGARAGSRARLADRLLRSRGCALARRSTGG